MALKPTQTKDLLAANMPPGMTDKDFCKACDYPLLTGYAGCSNCDDVKKAKADLLAKHMEAIGGDKAWKEYTAKGFVITPQNEDAFAMAREFNPAIDNLYLFGVPGAGKSRLAAIAKRRWVTSGKACMTISIDDIALNMRTLFRDARDQKDYLKRLIDLPILSIEDLGVEKPTETTVNILFQLIDGRYKARRNGLIITSNCSLEELSENLKNSRITSRIYELCKVFDLTQEVDWRRQ